MLDRLELEDIVARQSEAPRRTSTWVQVAVVVSLFAVFALMLVKGM